MLKLRQLEIQGFKSFVDKTKIEINDDFLIVVGPNGSGKSNVADCILWAIGEQSAKNLRGASMQDVIFKGTKKRPAAGSAEVFLLFEKEDGQKIRVGRRLSRNGDSAYMIDDDNVRLKDIHEFCYRNNISVHGSYLVEQGRVEKMLALSPQDRKSLFEEVAGIAHYKESRKASESKLAFTQNNLLRANDIIVEVEAEQAELKKQAAKAERYNRLQEELNVKKRAFFGRNLQELKARKGLLDEELKLYYDEKEKRIANLATLESSLEASRLRKADEEAALSRMTGALHELDLLQQKKNHENDNRLTQIRSAKERIQQIEGEQVILSQKEKERRKSLAALEAKKAESSSQKEEISAALSKASRHVDDLKEKIASAVKEIDAKRKVSMDLAQERSGSSNALNHNMDGLKKQAEREARHKRELEALAAQREKAEQLLADEEASLLSRSKRLAEKEAEAADARREIEEIVKTIGSLVREISEREKEIVSCQSTISAHREQERLQKGKARDILEKRDGSLDGSKLTSVLARLPRKTLKALELVLGEALLGYRLNDSRKILALLDSVKDEVKERVAFLALDLKQDKPQPPAEMKAYRSFEGYVDEMEGFPQWLKPHVRRTARFTDSAEAVAFSKKTGLPSIINDSVIINPEGLIFGGPAKELAIPLLKLSKEIEEAESQLEAARVKHSGFKEKLAAERKKEGDAVAAEKKLLEEKLKLQADVQHALVSKGKAESELKVVNSRETLLRDEAASIREEREELEAQKKNLEGRLRHLEKEIAETNGALSMLSSDEGRFRAEMEKAQEALTERLVEESQWNERNSILEEELEKNAADVDEVVSLKAKLENEKEHKVSMVKKLESDIVEDERLLGEILSEIAETKEKLQNFNDIIRTLEEDLQRSEKQVREARETLAEVQGMISEREKELAEVNSDHKNLVERFATDFEESPEALAAEWEGAPRMEPEERAAELLQVERLDKRIKEMGPQNLLAKEEYDKVSKRAEFLREQKKDVEKAIADLEETIRKANEAIKSRYLEAYEEVNKSFSELFKVVFDGGQAYLKLEDPDNPLESGIDIVAQPPGSVIQQNLLLSGGQKALVALTLLFAILSYRPQPFFLLDEVDAPLDDANIERVLSKLLLQFSDKTQFIVISHNKRTMALGNAIYGVTMEEHGISKIVSVNLKEVTA